MIFYNKNFNLFFIYLTAVYISINEIFINPHSFEIFAVGDDTCPQTDCATSLSYQDGTLKQGIILYWKKL